VRHRATFCLCQEAQKRQTHRTASRSLLLSQDIALKVATAESRACGFLVLAVNSVGQGSRSQVYVSHKRKDCEEGFLSLTPSTCPLIPQQVYILET